jgi:polyhydroxybutyrate depolymerase
MRKSWWLRVALVVGAMVVAVPTGAAAAAPRADCDRPATPGTTVQELTVDGEGRQYRLAIPATTPPSKGAPLLFNLHGLGSNMEQQASYSRLDEAAGARGYVVMTPQGRGGVFPRWSIPPLPDEEADVAFVRKMLQTTERTLCIDKDRVYVAGISNGAMFAAVIACALPGRIAAIAPVAGVNGASPCQAGTPPVSVLAFHGTADPIAPYAGGAYFSGPEPTRETALQARDVEATMARWARFDGCRARADESWLADDVQRLTYRGCPRKGTVELVRVVGGGHTWPGAIPVFAPRLGATTTSIDANSLMLDFFDAHPRAR